MRQQTQNIILLFILLGLCGCASRKNNTAQTRMYHAFFARYNTFYNGNEAFKKASNSQTMQHKDNFMEILPLIVSSDKNTQTIGSSDYGTAIEKMQKAIKNHSIKRKPRKKAGVKLSEKKKKFYAQKEFNPFLWRAWLTMAESYFRKGEFTEAASTFIYISRLYENDPDIVAKARIGLVKCYTEMEWFYESEDMLLRARRDSMPKNQEGELARAQANLLLKQSRFEEALPYLEKAIKRKGITSFEKAREYYLMGQLYHATGNDKTAYKYFGKTISLSPPYEMEINARIRQTETATNEKNKKKIIRSLKRMSKSQKNKKYIAQLYYAIGNMYLSDKDTVEAVKAYETGIAEGASGGYDTGVLHLTLAQIYWEQQRFFYASEHYQKAMGMLEKVDDDKNRADKLRAKFASELGNYSQSVESNSEYLYWETLKEEELLPLIDKKIEEQKWRAELQKKFQKKEEREAQGAGSDLAQAGANANMTIGNSNDGDLWYFYNPQIVVQGIKQFTSTWGDRKLKDFWRLSRENISLHIQQDTIAGDSIADTPDGANSILSDSISLEESLSTDTLSTDPTIREYYLQRIPRTDEEKNRMHKELKISLFESALIFEEKLGEKELTLQYFERLANEYPDFERLAEVYYHLFLSCSRWKESEKAEQYKELLIANFPDSSMSVRIQESDFFESIAVKRHKEDSIYVQGYSDFLKENYESVIAANEYAKRKYPNGKHRIRFSFIDALSKLYSGKQQEALTAIDELVNSVPEDTLSILAKEIGTGVREGRLLRSGITTSIWQRKSDGTIKSDSDSLPQFSTERNEPYCFILAYPNDSIDEKRLLFEIARYNFTRYMVRDFELEFKRQAAITLFEIKEFLNYDEAFIYRKRLYSNGEMSRMLQGINAFIISKSNLELLLQYYSFNDYIKFYEENLLNIPEPEIDGYTLDEPEYNQE